MIKGSKKNNQTIKNYLLAFIIFMTVIIGSLYIFEWYKVYQEEKLATSYLVKSDTIVNIINSYDEIAAVFSETADDYFVYISYTNEEDIYNMEKDLSKVINDYQIQDDFYYIDITELKKEPDYLVKLNKALGLEEYKITKVPTIIYVTAKMNQDNILLRADDNIMQAADFVQLLDIKGIHQ